MFSICSFPWLHTMSIIAQYSRSIRMPSRATWPSDKQHRIAKQTTRTYRRSCTGCTGVNIRQHVQRTRAHQSTPANTQSQSACSLALHSIVSSRHARLSQRYRPVCARYRAPAPIRALLGRERERMLCRPKSRHKAPESVCLPSPVIMTAGPAAPARSGRLFRCAQPP